MKSKHERRISERVALALPCQVMTDRSEVAAELRLLDLSAGGARIESGIALRPGELIALSFAASGDELTLFARVAHVDRRGFAVRGFGVEFLGLEADERALVERALRTDAAA